MVYSIDPGSQVWSNAKTNKYIDYLVSVHKLNYLVIPAKAGIQNGLKLLDSRLHGNNILVIYKQTVFIFIMSLKYHIGRRVSTLWSIHTQITSFGTPPPHPSPLLYHFHDSSLPTAGRDFKK